MADGLKATFLSNYVHTIILHSVLVAFTLIVYIVSPKIGSVPSMHQLLGELVGYSKEECSALGKLVVTTSSTKRSRMRRRSRRNSGREE